MRTSLGSSASERLEEAPSSAAALKKGGDGQGGAAMGDGSLASRRSPCGLECACRRLLLDLTSKLCLLLEPDDFL